MLDALRHRGPDDAQLFVERNVGLVHTRLSIVDLSDAARQPMRDARGRRVLTFNGEIYNHQDLRRRLPQRHYRSSGDTETLLSALAQWRTNALNELNGQYAFAAVDFDAQQLMLARDPFGIKPLYLAETDEEVWFASEPRALIAAGVVPQPEPDAWANILEGRRYGGQRTLLEPIRRLPPGHIATISLASGELSTWLPKPSARAAREPTHRDARRSRRGMLTSELERVLREAVHGALMADVAVGTLCSGGVDSSLITALAAQRCPDLIAFGARHSRDPTLDEGPAAQRAADAIGVELDLLDVTAETWRAGLVEATVHFGAPLANASSVTVAQMAERARRRGVKVLLTGEGADELFAGYEGLHGDLLRSSLCRGARTLRLLEPILIPGPGASRRGIARRALAMRARRRTEPGWSSLARTSDWPLDRRQAARLYAHHAEDEAALEVALFERMQDTLCHLLNRMDKNMMQHSVEARVPFLDPAVVDFALRLPIGPRVGPWTKGILRDVARRHLPWDVAHRPKIYGMDFDAGAWIEDAADPHFVVDGALRQALGLRSADLRRDLENARGALRVRIWSAEIWYRSHVLEQSVASIERDLWSAGP